MERKSAAKRGRKTKKHPLRVVYISNPMKVTASASEFRATVQRLTGKGAVWPSDLEFSDSQTASNVTTAATTTTTTSSDCDNNNGSIISDDSDCGVELLFPTPYNPSPDTSAASDDLCFLPSDHHTYGFPLFDDHEFQSLIHSDAHLF